MTSYSVYLNFLGTCRKAFDRYKSIFGGEFESVSTFGEMPPQDGMPIPEEMKDMIMHISLKVNDKMSFFGSDTGGQWAPDFSVGTNMSVSLDIDTREEADRLFDELSKDGKVTMPMNETFWGSYFGLCTDEFGVQWMFSVAI
ncbi:MAG: VOC family protein [Flavobacteriales bacterium]|nr:VOC family protein [Flavobacteriales bacterium]